MKRKKDNKRIYYFGIGLLILFLILGIKLYHLQIYKYDKFRSLSEGNRTAVIPISPPRGYIYDRNKKVLVSNKLTYTLSVIPDKVENLDNLSNELSQIVDLSQTEIREKINSNSSTEPVKIKRDISREVLILLEENKSELPGLIIEETPIREYVYKDLASHVLGYVGEISAAELKKYSSQIYSSRDIIGKTGLELFYEKYLRGEEGAKLIEVNNLGQKVKTLAVEEPTQGNSLILNLDYDLQKFAEKTLQQQIQKLTERAKKNQKKPQEELDEDAITKPPKGGSVIISNPDDGSILAMANYPSYDLSLFSGPISNKKWQQLNQNPLHPLLNRATNTSAPSGSIFKIVTAGAALEELGIEKDDMFYDPGYFKVGGVEFKNWYPGGQGDISFVDAIAWSNNTVFFKLGYRLYKKDKTLLQSYAHEFGLGSKTQIDLNNEAKGLVPGPKWRKNYFDKRANQIWYPGYTINLSIGQGNLRVSPIQISSLINSVANGGQLYQPLLVDKIIDPQGEVVKNLKAKLFNEIPVSDEHLKIIKQGLKGVTTYGTARRSFSELPVTAAGKTGTAQTGSNRPNHGWFAGFAPVDDPEISIVVFIEYGSSSSNTLPIAKNIIKEYFDTQSEKKAETE
ncbi:penicillin-binding protein 2 [Halanaerobacter jeridensis]|uniref:Penicillin-binding protein 2 n=1 Tax=Halanaerobacter jeridensis TaxID=706427 RepID=A0A938XR56_9FIRM|nr:penicillin-binding protein 2 [Halanaerobacter jeridensis]